MVGIEHPLDDTDQREPSWQKMQAIACCATNIQPATVSGFAPYEDTLKQSVPTVAERKTPGQGAPDIDALLGQLENNPAAAKLGLGTQLQGLKGTLDKADQQMQDAKKLIGQ